MYGGRINVQQIGRRVCQKSEQACIDGLKWLLDREKGNQRILRLIFLLWFTMPQSLSFAFQAITDLIAIIATEASAGPE